jgi:protein SCO1
MTQGFAPLLGVVLLTGIGALAWGTQGFRVLTTDGARRLAIEQRAPAVPDARLVDQNGNPFSLRDYRGKAVLVEFIYTRCPSLCGVLGDDFRHLLDLAQGAGRGDVDFVSISFDRQNDDPEALKLYGDRYGATPPLWRVAVPADGRGLAALLQTFGVVAIPDGTGGFVHNGALYLVNAQGRLTRILDPGAPPRLIREALRASRQ